MVELRNLQLATIHGRKAVDIEIGIGTAVGVEISPLIQTNGFEPVGRQDEKGFP